MEENFLKQTHAQRQEAAQTRREEKKRAEKERIMNEEDPERQRRLEVLNTYIVFTIHLFVSIKGQLEKKTRNASFCLFLLLQEAAQRREQKKMEKKQMKMKQIKVKAM